ncbi:MAG: GNAT family N-acetyltransferase [Treponema sp.]|nr:GNAT family N-acetyltransferase [Treponema sp.]
MEGVVIRDVEARDVPGIKKVIREVWGWASIIKDEGALDAAVGLYLNQILYNGTFGRVAVLNESVAGVICGYVKGVEPKYRMLLEDGTAHALTLLGASEAVRKSVHEFFSKTEDVYARLLGGMDGEYDGTLDFLILGEGAQGLGIGKSLWLAIKAYFLENDAKAVYLYSDTECNFGFYESQGFKRKRELEATFFFEEEPYVTNQFLYEYRLSQESAGEKRARKP